MFGFVINPRGSAEPADRWTACFHIQHNPNTQSAAHFPVQNQFLEASQLAGPGEDVRLPPGGVYGISELDSDKVQQRQLGSQQALHHTVNTHTHNTHLSVCKLESYCTLIIRRLVIK